MPNNHCINPADCILSKAIKNMADSAQKTQESSIRTEEAVKNLAATVTKIDDRNREDHKDIYDKFGSVSVSNASKLTASNIVPWIIVAISLAGLVISTWG